jgi:hypothetical protein
MLTQTLLLEHTRALTTTVSGRHGCAPHVATMEPRAVRACRRLSNDDHGFCGACAEALLNGIVRQVEAVLAIASTVYFWPLWSPGAGVASASLGHRTSSPVSRPLRLREEAACADVDRWPTPLAVVSRVSDELTRAASYSVRSSAVVRPPFTYSPTRAEHTAYASPHTFRSDCKDQSLRFGRCNSHV